MTAPPLLRQDTTDFAVFLAVFLVIVGVIVYSGNLLIAPPFAVTAYLIAFAPRSRFSQPSAIAASYLVVVVSSALFQLGLGVTVIALVLNVVVVSLFITFTPFRHPPALALTIFSFIAHDPAVFTETSLLVLVIILAAAVLIERFRPARRPLSDRTAPELPRP